MDANIFRAIGELAIGAKRRTEKQYADFLAFYRQLVETMPSEMVELFGEMKEIEVRYKDGGKEKVNLLLSASDFMWWKRRIEIDGLRFVEGIDEMQTDILARFANRAETHRLSPEERKNLLSLLEQATAEV